LATPPGTLAAVSTRLRDEIDLGPVADELLVADEETMQPARMALWLRPVDGTDEDLNQGTRPTPTRGRSCGHPARGRPPVLVL
jgi:hypothetical protein